MFCVRVCLCVCFCQGCCGLVGVDRTGGEIGRGGGVEVNFVGRGGGGGTPRGAKVNRHQCGAQCAQCAHLLHYCPAALFFTAVGDNAVGQTSTETRVSNIRLCVNVDFLAFHNFVYSFTIYRSILQFSGFFNQTSIDQLKLESPILLGYV